MKRLIQVLITTVFTLTGVNAFCQEPDMLNELRIINLSEWDYVNHNGFKVIATTSGYLPDEWVKVDFYVANITNREEGWVTLVGTIGEDSPEDCSTEVIYGGIPVSIVSVGALCSGASTAINRFTIVVDVEGSGISPGDIILVIMTALTATNDATEGFGVIAK